MKELGLKAGVAINPHTSEHLLSDIINVADYILIMSVNPGFGGQKFIPYTIEKIKRTKQLIESINPQCEIEVDGGVTLDNISLIASSGADSVVAGSSVFGAPNPVEAIRFLQNAGR